MTMNIRRHILAASVVAIILGCGGKKEGEAPSDRSAEAMLEGVWLNDEDETVVFKAVGDTLYYPDASLMPVHFRIYGDTMYLDGSVTTKYLIEKLTPNVFRFRNMNDEVLKLVKSDDPDFESSFPKEEEPVEEVNQELLKRDTVVTAGETRYHCYMQVNPTTFKVVKDELSDDGIGVGKVYYDNIVNLTVYIGARRIYSSDFRKQDFAGYVPEEILPHCILSDIVYMECDPGGVVFQAQLRIPESASSYIADIRVSKEGRMTIRKL